VWTRVVRGVVMALMALRVVRRCGGDASEHEPGGRDQRAGEQRQRCPPLAVLLVCHEQFLSTDG
jgi:hypothetical protein